MTTADASNPSPEKAAGGHLLLERVAAGDVEAFGALYDAFVAETYAICLRNMPGQAADRAMAALWMFVWANAAALNEQAGTTKSIVLSAAWAITTDRSTSSLRRLTRKAWQTPPG
ncbi:hypothetical protein JF66_04585 [Cryobacterium sp. MLB-32]|uniref:hypothetical protein n=1 Tax=Cryobacterium sp. MLB-32 TaxID=1529318 RepID=UPI0004E6DE76|nr:hypothetical protein [Cryobacterium sp. MLB-32]KFF60422.1 hypothetical protein JF66_04585 [Cryobacterium sp. MLB-32]